MRWLGTNLNDFGVNAVRRELSGNFAEREEGVALFTRAAVDKEYFHVELSEG